MEDSDGEKKKLGLRVMLVMETSPGSVNLDVACCHFFIGLKVDPGA